MSQRSRARQVAFQVLYQDEMNPRSAPAVGELLITRRLHSEEAMEFARSLISGVRQNLGELDPLLETIAEHWALKRMAATDRNILRLGAYELLHTDTPPRVAIDEAVELAKRFGTAHSAQFVNGILDRVMHGNEGTPNPEP
jgi:transcription antitermination protein NusB